MFPVLKIMFLVLRNSTINSENSETLSFEKDESLFPPHFPSSEEVSSNLSNDYVTHLFEHVSLTPDLCFLSFQIESHLRKNNLQVIVSGEKMGTKIENLSKLLEVI